MRVRKLKGRKVDTDILNKRRCEAKIDEIEEMTMLQETKALEEVQEKMASNHIARERVERKRNIRLLSK